MKKLNVKKEIFVMMLIVAIMIALSSTVFASAPIVLNGINTGTTSVDGNEISKQQIDISTSSDSGNAVSNTLVVKPIVTSNTTTNTTGSTYQNNTSLPQTGDASDYAIFAVIAVAVVVAIYAYKKVRDYNI